MMNDGIRVCSSCGLPPRDNKNKLRCCSRCKNAWYHDLECQKRHYPTHKTTCRPASKPSSSNDRKQQLRKASIEPRYGRGNCLVSSSLIKKGECMHCVGSKSWEPLVLPVLRADCRTKRCAYCFKTLEGIFFRYDEVKPRQEYILLFCSTRCRHFGQVKLLLQEERAVARLYSSGVLGGGGGGPPKIFPTAILLYRIITQMQLDHRESKLLKHRLDKLQHEIADTTADLSDSAHHTRAVITTVEFMIQTSSDDGNFTPLPSMQAMQRMVYRIKLNGFSICDGESVAMGIGIFGAPSFMNHSCRPNAVQTFLYGGGEPPSLLVTAFEDIPKGAEICISYIDNLAPKQIRCNQLKNNYFFDCRCNACEDPVYNSEIIGLKCSNCDTKSPKMIVESSMASAEQVLKCQVCGSVDSHDGFPIVEKMERLSTIDDAATFYHKLKQSYASDSWYVQNCGDQLVQMLLDMLGSQADDNQQQSATASRVLQVLIELNESCKPSAFHVWSSLFRNLIRQYKTAKLGLFLLPDPRQSISELQTVRKSLMPYLTLRHELIQQIDACMHGGMS